MYAEFGRLLHDDVHFLAPGYALYQSNPEWRFGIAGHVMTNTQVQLLFRDFVDGCGVFTATAVKYRQPIACPESQYATDVVRLLAVEREYCICAQLNRTEQAWCRHRISSEQVLDSPTARPRDVNRGTLMHRLE